MLIFLHNIFILSNLFSKLRLYVCVCVFIIVVEFILSQVFLFLNNKALFYVYIYILDFNIYEVFYFYIHYFFN